MGSNSVYTRTYDIPTGTEKNQHVTIHITEPVLSAEGLSLTTWAGASILASLVHRLTDSSIRFPPDLDKSLTIPILELGAGTGMVGMSSASRWNQPALLTDLDPIVPGITANIEMNRALLGANDVGAGTLDWYHPSNLKVAATKPDHTFPFAKSTQAHLILAADTVYSEEHPMLLSSVIPHWLSHHPDSRAIICYPLRVAYLDEIREVWSRFEEVGLECVEEGRQDADPSLFDDECLCEWSIWRWKKDAN